MNTSVHCHLKENSFCLFLLFNTGNIIYITLSPAAFNMFFDGLKFRTPSS